MCHCFGGEPNGKVTETLESSYENMSFKTAMADNLPFETSSFDLVILRSVLHWVDRNFILQSLGEAIRVSRKWIIVSDFCPSRPYKVLYKHKKGLFTWKIDYEQLLLNTGILELFFTQVAVNQMEDSEVRLLELDNDAHKSGKYDWDYVKTSIFMKNFDLIPIHDDISDISKK